MSMSFKASPDGTYGEILINGTSEAKIVSGATATNTTAGRLLKVGDFGIGITPIALHVFGYTSWNQIKDNNLPNADVMAVSLADGPTGAQAWLIGKWECNAPGLWGRLTVSEFTSGSLGSQRTWVRTLVNGVWQAWQRVYQQGDILGTVSQSSGVPTGAIIERGSNANGEYVRFADGTMICTRRLGASSSATAVWTFPAAFYAIGAAQASADASTVVISSIQSISNTSVSFNAWNLSGARVTNNVSLTAIGQWY